MCAPWEIAGEPRAHPAVGALLSASQLLVISGDLGCCELSAHSELTGVCLQTVLGEEFERAPKGLPRLWSPAQRTTWRLVEAVTQHAKPTAALAPPFVHKPSPRAGRHPTRPRGGHRGLAQEALARH